MLKKTVLFSLVFFLTGCLNTNEQGSLSDTDILIKPTAKYAKELCCPTNESGLAICNFYEFTITEGSADLYVTGHMIDLRESFFLKQEFGNKYKLLDSAGVSRGSIKFQNDQTLFVDYKEDFLECADEPRKKNGYYFSKITVNDRAQ